MFTKRYYPLNLEHLLEIYEKSYHKLILSEYNRIYDQNINLIIENIETITDNEIKNFEEHNYLLSVCLQPFLTNKIQNYDLLFVDPLYFSKKKKEIEEIPTFDFLLGQKEEGILKTLIFGEIKGQSPKSEFNKDILLYYRTNSTLKEKLFNYIRELESSIRISEELIFEFVLVGKGIDSPEFKQSIIEKEVPFILWSVSRELLDNTYRIIIEEDLYQSRQFSLRHDSRYLVDFFRSNRFEYKPILEFTHSLDTISILFRIRDDYFETYGTEIKEENLNELIYEIGLGDYYDDSRIIPNLIERFIKKGMDLKILRKKEDKIFFKKIDIKEKINSYRLRKKIEKSDGHNFFQNAVKNIKPLRRGILKFLNKD